MSSSTFWERTKLGFSLSLTKTFLRITGTLESVIEAFQLRDFRALVRFNNNPEVRVSLLACKYADLKSQESDATESLSLFILYLSVPIQRPKAMKNADHAQLSGFDRPHCVTDSDVKGHIGPIVRSMQELESTNICSIRLLLPVGCVLYDLITSNVDS